MIQRSLGDVGLPNRKNDIANKEYVDRLWPIVVSIEAGAGTSQNWNFVTNFSGSYVAATGPTPLLHASTTMPFAGRVLEMGCSLRPNTNSTTYPGGQLELDLLVISVSGGTSLVSRLLFNQPRGYKVYSNPSSFSAQNRLALRLRTTQSQSSVRPPDYTFGFFLKIERTNNINPTGEYEEPYIRDEFDRNFERKKK